MAVNEVELLCIGNALIDVFVRTDEAAAARYGITRPVQHIEIEKIQAFLSDLPPGNVSPVVYASGVGAGKSHARHRACSEKISDTACPPENVSPVVCSSGVGAGKPHARHRACSEKISDTACPPENVSPVVYASGVGAGKSPARHRACFDENSDTACLPGNVSPVVCSSGGGAANAAKIAGFLGARVRFIGAACIPENADAQKPPARHRACSENTSDTAGAPETGDWAGRLFEKELRDAGVELKLVRKSRPTGICLMLRIGDETRIAASPSAALELSESDIRGEDFEGVKLAVIDGFMLGRPALVRRVLEFADHYGIPAALDLSSPAIAREYAAEIESYARRYALFLFMNEAEAWAFYRGLKTGGSGEGGKGTAPAEENREERFRLVCSFFRAFTEGKQYPAAVVKLGERGAVCFAGGKMYPAETRALAALDATGAGDAFLAAFLTARVRARPPGECAAFGNMAAAIVLDTMGTRLDGKRYEEIARRLKER